MFRRGKSSRELKRSKTFETNQDLVTQYFSAKVNFDFTWHTLISTYSALLYGYFRSAHNGVLSFIN